MTEIALLLHLELADFRKISFRFYLQEREKQLLNLKLGEG